MAKLLWQPSIEMIGDANLTGYMDWLRDEKQLTFQDYTTLWEWSVHHSEDFWKTIWEYFDIEADGDVTSIISSEPMPRTRWFEGTRLNYAEHIFRKATDTTHAIIYGAENKPVQRITWNELKQQTGSLQQILRDHNIQEGDTVAGYLPCIPEATISLLATTSLGAIWSSCSPDFGTQAVIDRFAQIKPKVLIAVDQYQYNGKSFDKKEVIDALVGAIPTLKLVIIIADQFRSQTNDVSYILWNDAMSTRIEVLEFTRVPFAHPLWILFSSGTTGLPKAITHSHGGILIEHLKYGAFHNDFKPGERCFWYTTTGWMMWNYIHASLLAGSTMVLYDGSPAYPNLDVLWKFCAEVGINHFGTSAGFILANMKANVLPGENYDLSSLRSIGSTGSTLPEEGFDWVYKNVKKDIWLASMSGGTDVCSAFVGGNPLWPVYSGEIQCRTLGCSLESWDEDGKSLQGEEGEMVITKPMPSMPVFFWDDAAFKRYEESYFEMYPGIWRHGDWVKITERLGVIIYGRSDATLNRGGVRIGTSEIYRAVDQVKEVKDSLVVCIEKGNGDFWMPLFVVMRENSALDDAIKKNITKAIREAYTPRHVPDEIIAIPDIPYTISGKKTETPVKKILTGKDPGKVVNAGSLRNPDSLQFFSDILKKRQRN
jgi:acetoacetyl-CoA synthetase